MCFLSNLGNVIFEKLDELGIILLAMMISKIKGENTVLI